MPPRYYDKVPKVPDLVLQYNGTNPIDQVTARWVCPQQPEQSNYPLPTVKKATPPTPLALLEVYQSHDAGAANDPESQANFDPHDEYCGFNYTPLGKVRQALTAAGWKQVNESIDKNFNHLYYQPPEGKAWKPTRRLYNLNNPNTDQEPAPPARLYPPQRRLPKPLVDNP